MKTLIKLVFATVMLTAAVAAQAGTVHGHCRSSGTYVTSHYRSSGGSFGGYSGYSSSSRDYVYRNPYAAYPSVSVGGYYRDSGTHVLPYVRTSPNWTPTDNLGYRGYGTIRVPR